MTILHVYSYEVIMARDTLIDIRAFRQRIGLTQKQLAEAVQVTPNTVARWGTGRTRHVCANAGSA